jgi:hypothetical protein
VQFREKARPRLVLCLVVAAAGWYLTGCQNKPVTPVLSPPPQIKSDRPYVDPAEIVGLLDDAEAAMQREQFSYPAKGSAVGLFDAVLAKDPDNAEAKRGLERIVETYLKLAESAAQRNQLARAQSMLARARIVDADHPAVAPTVEQIRLLANAKRERLVLDKAQLRDRQSQLTKPLKTLGTQARNSNCRTMIRVRNDSEGRWVYQQMNLAPGEARIRAQIEIGSPPLVELICFQQG